MNFVKKEILKKKENINNIKTENDKETIFSFINLFLSFLFVVPLMFMIFFPNRFTIMLFVFLTVLNINLLFYLKR